MTPLHIVHVITGLGTGGAETMLCKLAEYSDASVLKQSVISLTADGALQGRLEKAGVEVFTLGMNPGRPSLGGMLKLRKYLKQLAPDLIQGWMYHGNIAAWAGRKLAGVKCPVVGNIRHSLHDIHHEKPLTQKVITMHKALSKHVQAIIYNAEISARQHEAFGLQAQKTKILPNGFDCDMFQPDQNAKAQLCQDIGVSPGQLIIGMVARYHPMKNHAGLLDALAMMKKEAPDFHAVMVGTDVTMDNANLTTKINDWGLSDHVTLMGERHDIDKIMPGFDLMVVPSLWGEAFPNVLGEAMACGVPCIATDIGDSRLIIGETGQVIAPDSTAALAEALVSYAHMSPVLRQDLSNKARQRVIDEFEISSIVARYQSLYQDIVQT